jgi:hypothetical protein
MVIRYNDIVSVITTLADENNIQVSVKETLKGGFIAGTSCTLGGLLLGPPGLAIGGTVGGGLAYCLTKDKFKPMSQVILQMSPALQQQLVDSVLNIVHDLDAADAVTMLALLRGNMLLRAKITEEMTRFAANEMNLHLAQ